MKKLITPGLFLLLLGGAACNVLDKQPLPSVSPNNFFKSADDAEAAITAAYDALQFTGTYGQDLNVVGEMPSDDCTTTNGDVLTLDKIQWTPSSSQVYNVFRDSYIGINRANAVLKYVPAVSMPVARRNEILGEARFLRALHYFNLVKLYGAVPLRLDPTETGDPAVIALPRTPADQVYAQIVTDLTQADALAPSSNPTRATKGAANALLARVQLTQRQWPAVIAAANKVLSNGSYSLNAPFKSLYPADNKPESIFEVQFAGTADGGNILPDLLLPNPPATYSFPKFNIPTPGLIALPTAADTRWAAIGTVLGGVDHASYVQGSGSGNDSGPFVYKWSSNPNGFNSPDNTYVLRLADVLLMYAEASNEQSGPSQDCLDKLNRVRVRAGLAALTLASPAAASTQTLRNEIDTQRRLELAFEGERWFDLLRYARHNQVTPGAHAYTALDMIATRPNGARDVNYLLFPIPQAEINNNAQLQQNPGY